MQQEQASQTSISTAYIRHPCTTTVFQTFRNGLDVVRIEAVLHPVSGTFVVLWSDIKVCFPGLTRLQNKNIYVPLLRGPDAYRYGIVLTFFYVFNINVRRPKKAHHIFFLSFLCNRIAPLGIQHLPGVILDVVYDTTTPKIVKVRCHKKHYESEPEPFKIESPVGAVAIDLHSTRSPPIHPSLLPATAVVRPHVICPTPGDGKLTPLEDTIRAIELAANATGLFASQAQAQSLRAHNVPISEPSVKAHPQSLRAHNAPVSGPSAKAISKPALSVANSNLDSESSEEDFVPPSFQSKTSPKEIDPAVIKEFVNAANSSAATNRGLSAHLADFTNILQKSNAPTSFPDQQAPNPRMELCCPSHPLQLSEQ
jgi:hypothetical protein